MSLAIHGASAFSFEMDSKFAKFVMEPRSKIVSPITSASARHDMSRKALQVIRNASRREIEPLYSNSESDIRSCARQIARSGPSSSSVSSLSPLSAGSLWPSSLSCWFWSLLVSSIAVDRMSLITSSRIFSRITRGSLPKAQSVGKIVVISKCVDMSIVGDCSEGSDCGCIAGGKPWREERKQMRPGN